MTEPSPGQVLREKLNQETAPMRWSELQPFFARGLVVAVAGHLDLIDVAAAFAEDQAARISVWRKDGEVDLVQDQQAQGWFETDQELWTLVVKPWVLVQPIPLH
ncbi:hypothetical protein A6D6_01212 [Alcanivorax xiamenensis]|uniref:DUF2288 domain-containing protein n=1 Tax=Alcanivorax xiamenensis TaxID=1177156 RepID=A0ABQ6YAF8_9GAMM|nr:MULTISPECIES: DUF2288 domain-containing protein [Alcanivorax]KAF0806848.1 hypothetical protein A6D6_01212 [Alcanivorax xiamenensis]